MIDRQARTELGQLLRHFLAGRLTNYEYDERSEEVACRTEDALYAVWWETWHLYDDFKTQRVGKEIVFALEERRTLARWILFLQHDFEYEWQEEGALRKWQRKLAFHFDWIAMPPPLPWGEANVWPFFRRLDFEYALRHPKLLCGSKGMNDKT